MIEHVSGGSSAAVRIRSLTGLRWLAALAVFVSHTEFLNDSLAWITWIGWSGVPLFFLLSGFVLTWSQPASDTAPAFYRRRFARIYPLHVVALVLAIPVFYLATGTPLSISVVMGLVLLQSWWPFSSVSMAGNPVSWTLSNEAFFYLLLPLVLLCRATRRAWLGVAVVGLVMPWLAVAVLGVAGPPSTGETAVLYLGRLPVQNLGLFVAGVGLARAMRLGWRPRVPAPAVWGTMAASIAALMIEALVADVPSRTVTWLLLSPTVAPACAVLLVSLVSTELEGGRSWLGTPRIVALGTWSFAFYLVHLTVIYGLRDLHGGHPFGGVAAAAVVLLALGVSIAVAASLHRYVERTFETRMNRSRQPIVVKSTVSAAAESSPRLA